MIRKTILTLCLGLATFACSKEQEAPAETKPAVVEAKAPAPVVKAPELVLPDLSPDEPLTELSELPTPEELEEEAEKTVQLENMETELDRLEAEIMGG